MTPVIRKPQAEADLLEIWSETFRRWGAAQADDYVDAITEAIEGLVEFPERGAACEWIRRGYRRLMVRSHIVFYKLHPDAVEIVRVLHERMDWEERL